MPGGNHFFNNNRSLTCVRDDGKIVRGDDLLVKILKEFAEYDFFRYP